MRPEGLNNIVIVGAGSAGWMTALYIKRVLPYANITVIGSRELGILGAGEGTVPSFKHFLDIVQIHPYDLFKKCKSTAKLGIKFVNWKGDGGYYYHSFSSANLFFTKEKIHKRLPQPLELAYQTLSCYLTGDKQEEYEFADRQMATLKMPFVESDMFDAVSEDSLRAAWHFDAIEVAHFFEEVGISRGIRYVDDTIHSFNQDDNGYITTVHMNGGSLDCDFIFDCSGFKRLIIGKLYNSEWIDVSDRLPVNRALPFTLPPSNPLKNYTTATAMKHGWVWEIPLQHRTGCGYLFNSNFCDDETAIKELKEKYGDQVEIPRSFSFNAGYYKETWIKNCIALGLSSGFLEPLEATSIWTTTSSFTFLTNCLTNLPKAPQALIDGYNRSVRLINDSNIAFIQFHYRSGRNDTEFWKDVIRRPLSKQDENIYNIMNYRIPSGADLFPYTDAGIQPIGWYKVGAGISFFDKKMVAQQLETARDYYHNFNDNKHKFKEIVDRGISQMMTHQRFLEILVGKEKLEENRKLIFK